MKLEACTKHTVRDLHANLLTMAGFSVSTNLPPNKYLEFRVFDDKLKADFLNPEDTKVGVVSVPFDFGILEPLEKGWKLFAEKLKGLLEQDKNPTNLTDKLKIKEHDGRNQIRATFSTAGPVKKYFLDQEYIIHPMRLKLLSNIPLHAPDLEREQGYLVKLARLCGAKNVNLFIDLKSKESEKRYKFSWNENELLWETEEVETLGKMTIGDRGKATEWCGFGEIKLELQLKAGGVNRVLRQIYGKPGDNWLRQRQLLMEETYSDLVIISNHAKHQNAQTPIKCHKVYLAGTSKVFTDMIRDCSDTAEGQEPIISLPESEDAIQAMLHFIYYGGTNGIFGNKVNISVVMELLEAGKKYKIPNLAEITNFVLSLSSPVDKNVELCCYSRNSEGEALKQKKEAFEELSRKPIDELMKSKVFLKVYEIAEKLGPVFISVLSKLKYYHRVEQYVPYSEVKVSKEEAELIYNFLCCSEDYLFPRNLDIGVGLIILAEFCGKNLPPFSEWIASRFFGETKTYQADYLVDLFCLAREKEQDVKCWRELKMGAIRKLKLMMLEEPLMLEESYKYQGMLRTNVEAADELKFAEIRIMNERSKWKRFI